MFQLKWRKKTAVPGKPLKRKLPGTDEEEKCEKNKRWRASNGKETKYEMASIQPWRKFDDVHICMDYYLGKEMQINNLKDQNHFPRRCTNRKIPAVTDHEKSSLHLKAVEVLKTKNKSMKY